MLLLAINLIETINPGGTPLQKSFKIRSWVPSPQSHNLEEAPTSHLKEYRRGLVSSELLSETEIIFLLETKGQAASERRAVKEDELPAELEQHGQRERRGAGSATCSRWRTSGARSSSSGSLTGRYTWHSAS